MRALILYLLAPLCNSWTPGSIHIVPSTTTRSPPISLSLISVPSSTTFAAPRLVASLGLSILLSLPVTPPAYADVPSIQPCAADARCVSTSTVSSLRGYASPWLVGKGTTASLTSELKSRGYKLTMLKAEVGGEDYVRGQAEGETVEFLIKPADGVVLYSSTSPASKFSLYDPLKQLTSILTESGFQNGATEGQEYKKEGFVGELKAFYGMQSGKGWEDVLDE